MKPFRMFLPGLLLLGTLALARAQFDPIDWYTLDGGGGTSAGGLFSLSGTIAQPDAMAVAGGQFALTGGFWSLDMVVDIPGVPGFPNLTIRTAGNDVVIHYLPAQSGLVLQSNNTLSPAGWTDLPNGRTNFVRLPAPGSAQFFRLRR